MKLPKIYGVKDVKDIFNKEKKTELFIERLVRGLPNPIDTIAESFALFPAMESDFFSDVEKHVNKVPHLKEWLEETQDKKATENLLLQALRKVDVNGIDFNVPFEFGCEDVFEFALFADVIYKSDAYKQQLSKEVKQELELISSLEQSFEHNFEHKNPRKI